MHFQIACEGLSGVEFASVFEVGVDNPTHVSQTLHSVKKLDYLCNCRSEISNVCNAMEDHCLQAMKIVHHYANGCFDWLISGHQSVNPSREAISILSGKYKSITFLHPVV